MAERLRVLVRVGERNAREHLVTGLERLGAAIQEAPDCLTAMAIVKSGTVDVALIGGEQGGFDVLDTARVLKSLCPDRYLPVLAIVGRRLDEEARGRLLAGEVDEVLGPDFDEALLQCRLHGLLRLKNAHDQLRKVRAELERTVARESQLLKQLREDNRNLKVRSITDGLTALYNYRYLMEWMKTEFKISRRYGHSLALMIADIDHFKRVNDEYGHPFGDEALKEVAVILRQCARESDLVARYAGDEFALVCPRSGRKEVRSLARRILVATRRHRFVCKGQRVPLSLSIGTATYPEDPEVTSPELLVLLADQALYQRKRQGRNGVTAWDELDPESRLAIRRDLHGPGHPLLAEDPKSRVELEAAARLAGMAARPTSPRSAGPSPRNRAVRTEEGQSG